ncbi:putative DNA-binding transcriptional regulator YafY [Clostridium beijerinckii]|uniref:helix-turn-helix transcriptional regulator n=1 Tax=Clostridium beijerinckii TaxID=1520 RepID=UPI001493E8EE|nr:WYL domain-containing protein [Clostridium beijerinckii]NOW85871.1 putative DNA-binding transcriptional regulator YafY [Clostridium beijerinckii]
MEFLEESDKKRDVDEEISSERLTIYRILDLYNLINKEKQFNKGVFVEEAGTSERTVRRDIKCLNDYFKRNYENNGFIGVCREITYCRKDNVYKVNVRGDCDFSESDIYAFVKVIIQSRAFTRKEIQRMLSILKSQVKDTSVIKEIIEKEELYYVEPQHKKNIIDLLWNMRNSIERGKKVEFDYTRADGRKKHHIVNPIAIVFNEYYFYLIAEVEKESSKIEISFRVDRIKNYIETKEISTYPYGRFEEDKYRKKVQFMYTGDFKTIEFEFFGDSIEAVLDRLPTAKVIGKTDKAYKVRAEIYGEGVKRWILSQKEFLKVTKPKEYIDEIKETIQRMYELYV